MPEDILTLGRASNKKILDFDYLMNVVNEYNESNFFSMCHLILEYGEHKFFQDLYELFASQEWRNIHNKYLNYVGITIQYAKYRILVVGIDKNGE
jgi:hypothetical protein